MRIIVHPLLADGGHARYPNGYKSARGDLVVNIIHLDDHVNPIVEELEAIRRRLDGSQGPEEPPGRRPARHS